ncbi:MAG: AAA family ATPase [Gammaproteobacteria bacterium]|nr:AAA family ATPase [Gammaproteobacteria bacterium]NNF60870.1 AAA family ATPase [Gammaproteobacteria bacterium]NNM21741.1 AAA family ATPase [Gammaproteobacteria bacterium]
MYTQYFGLREKPFAITPDPQYLYLSNRHGEALAHLLYGVTESGGFIQLTGEVGTGKTLLTRSLLERLPDAVDLAVVLNPRLSAIEFLETIFDELHLDKPADASIKALVDSLNKHLLDAHAAGRHTVLLVDEAQNLDADVLEQLRLLTNLETSKQKLLQIILVGQPELRQTLARNDLRQLAQRITGRYHLTNLTAPETRAYVQHRLDVAGARRPIFSRLALAEVHRASGGVPRLINVICDRALLGAYTSEKPLVSRQIVRAAAAEVSGQAVPSRVAAWLPEIGLAAAGLAAAILLFAWLLPGRPNLPDLRVQPGAATGLTALTGTLSLNDDSEPLRGLRLSRQLDASPISVANAAPLPNPAGWKLTDLLQSSVSLTGTDAAMRSLLRLWQVNLDGRQGPPCEQIRARNLRCEFQVGSWPLLQQLDRPAVLSLVVPGGNTHQVVLAGINGDDVQLMLGSKSYTVAANQVRELWFGEYLLVWRPNPVADSLMVPGISSEGVGWLRRQLEQLQGGPVIASSFYDESLAQRVRRFQRSRSLAPDGMAGVHTLIALNNAIGSNEPRLQERR